MFREIRSTFGRFIAIFAISALGAGFYAGLKVTSPDMKATGDAYYADRHLADYRLVSTMGFTEDDVAALAARGEADAIMAGYGIDLLMTHPEGAEVARVMSLPEGAEAPRLTGPPADGGVASPAYLNRLVVEQGRLPTAPGECFADNQSGYHLGDVLTVAPENDTDSLDLLAAGSFTVVGVGRSPSYVSFQRGNSTIGSGRVDYFLYVPPGAFDSEFYTEIFLSARGAEELSAFSHGYESLTTTGAAALEDFGKERAQIRYDDVVAEGREELADARKELAEGKQELADAERELADAEKELADGEAELADGKATAERELADAWRQIQDGEAELAEGKAIFTASENELAAALASLQNGEKSLITAKQQLDAGQREYDAGHAEYAARRADYDAASAQVNQLAPAVDAMPQLLGAIAAMTNGGQTEPPPGTLPPAFGEAAGLLVQTAGGAAAFMRATGGEAGAPLADGLQACSEAGAAALAAMDAGQGGALAVYAALQPLGIMQPKLAEAIAQTQAQLAEALPQLDAAAAELAAAKTDLDAGWAAYNSGIAGLEAGRRQLEEGHRQLDEARVQLADAEQELADGKREYYEEKAKAEQEIADAEAEIADGKKEIADGKIEIADAKREIADGEAEIADGQKELDELEVPDWYIFTREDNPGYAGFTSDTSRIDSIAAAIPVFFFLVAALVCLTTMTRMVEEQRPLIGTLKAMGYGRSSIAFKFLFYAGFASITGSVAGVLAGYLAFPITIWQAYSMMYIMPSISLWNDFPLAASSVLFSVLCILAATFAACAHELHSVPANLLRPKAPRAGKRVLLERVGPLWRRMSFMQKVSVRNLFRYKKRFFMTVIGVAGCSALLVTGFGLRDSIAGVVTRQYEGVNQYDMMVVLKEDSGAGAATDFNTALPQYAQGLYTASVLVNAETDDDDSGDMTVYLFVAENPAALPEFVDLHERKSGADIPFPGSGAVVTEKLADRLKLQAGDSFRVNRVNEEAVSLSVGGVAENYIFNYIYITPDEYRRLFGEAPGYDTVLLNLDDAWRGRADEVMAGLLSEEPVAAVMDIPTMREEFDDMFESLNAVVGLIIGAAGLLAFVVLYNLTNINITERTREIATLKVLGFYTGETAAYIYRENLLLTLIGIAFGLVLGVFLHDFVIITAEVDEVMFRRVIEPLSFVLSLVFTLLCAGLVNLVMLRRLRKVDMIESLKSVE